MGKTSKPTPAPAPAPTPAEAYERAVRALQWKREWALSERRTQIDQARAVVKGLARQIEDVEREIARYEETLEKAGGGGTDIGAACSLAASIAHITAWGQANLNVDAPINSIARIVAAEAMVAAAEAELRAAHAALMAPESASGTS